jgi:hypothetical protein
LIKINAKFGVMAIVAALFVAFGAFGLQRTDNAKAGALPPLSVYPEGSNTPYASGATIPSGTVLRLVANFGDNQAAASVTVTAPALNTVTPTTPAGAAIPAGVKATLGGLTLVPYPAAHSPYPATLYTTGIPNANQDVTPLVQDDDADITNATYTVNANTMNTIGTVQSDDLSLELTFKATCAPVTIAGVVWSADTSPVNIHLAQATPFADGVATLDFPFKCGFTAPAVTPGAGEALGNVLSITKVDQLGALKGASFAVQVGIGNGSYVDVATMVTSGSATSQNPCLSNTNCATNGTLYCQTGYSSNCAQTPGALPPTVSGGVTLADGSVRVIEIAQPTACVLVQILDGDGDLVVQPVTLTLPARLNDRTLKFINSCQTPLAPVVANSAIAVVIGGATQGLSNSTHIEIIPAPGSDDDARVDIRVRDTNSTVVPGAHVTMSIDKGAMSMRTDTTGAGTNCVTSGVGVIIGYNADGTPVYSAGPNNLSGLSLPNTCYNGNGYEVIEPSPGATYFGSNYAGDTCDQGISNQYASGTQYTYNPANNTYTPVSPYNGGVAAPFLLSGTGQLRQIQDGYTNTDGIISACVYVNPDLAPGVTPGKMNITVIIEGTNVGFYPYGAQNIILTATVTVVGPPASIKVAASPTSVQCGEKSTITATVTDSVGQNVSDHTRIELVSNAGATIGGTGSTLGFPGVGTINPASSSVAETFSGVGTAFLLTSTEHVGPYEVVVASGGSVGGVVSTAQPGVTYTTGNFSTAPVSAQVTVTCALPVVAAPVAPAASAPIAAPRTGEGIRPPNTGDAGLAASNSSSALFIVGGLMFALAGFATLKFARR